MTVMKIMCACGQGLGSSFLVEMNVEKVLKKLNLTHIEVTHASSADVYKGAADLFVVGNDLYESLKHAGDIISLTNIVSLPELEEKLTEYFKEKGVL